MNKALKEILRQKKKKELQDMQNHWIYMRDL
mgnify:CR=1 FL=1